MKKSLLFLITVLVVSSCAKVFVHHSFNQLTRSHKLVAVVPFVMVYTGRMDKDMTQSQIEKMMELESVSFQRAYYNELVGRSGPGKKDIKIDFQSIDKTNKILKDSGYVLHKISEVSEEELARVLGVDAIVKTRVEKEKFLEGWESFGIEMAEVILGGFGNNIPGGQQLPPGSNATNEIKIDSRVISADGLVLWQMAQNVQIDWATKPNDAIRQITRRFSRKFPYRNR